MTLETLPPHVPADKAMRLPFFAREVVKACPQETLIPEMHRTLGPITYVTNIFPGDKPGWLLTGYDDTMTMLRDPDNFTKNGMGQWSQSIGESWLVVPTEVDPPMHNFYRKALNPYFSPQKMMAMKADLRRRAVDLIGKFQDRQGCDFINEFSERYPIYIVLDLLGLPQDRMMEFLSWEKAMLHSNDWAVRSQGVRDAVGYLKAEIAERRQAPRDDYISKIFEFEAEDGRKWNDEEVLGHCFNLFLGGLDTVTTMLGNIFAHLARYPDQQQELRDHPERIVLAVEEFLRVYGPVTAFRIAVRELEIHGQTIMQGEYVSVSTPVVNQDPKLHDNPSEVRFDRKAAHVALGGGIHKCLGMHLARLELQTALEEFLKAIPPFRLKDDFELGYFVGNITFVPRLELQWD
ncbi:cytochrome P450 [Novosphingobium sp. AAP93]|uniref:cytochrome P450 n=1 Tax=Novosphingobium sp. AAP93 TaxID=1523427 RepID=UPI0006B96347|nr:cytochrome P450 [Novosphingobium sp. AAP93]